MNGVKRKVKALRKLTVQNGATPQEAVAAAELADRLELKHGDHPKPMGDAWTHFRARQAARTSRKTARDYLMPAFSLMGKALFVMAMLWVAMLLREAVKSVNCSDSNAPGCGDWSHPFWP